MKRKIAYCIAVIISVFIGVFNSFDDNIAYSSKEEPTNIKELGATTINTLEVNFVSNGGSSVNKIYVDYPLLFEVNLPTPTKTGSSFAGWYIDSSLKTEVKATLSNVKKTVFSGVYRTTLYAKWDLEPEIGGCVPLYSGIFTLNFNTNGGIPIPSTGVTFNKPASSLPENPKRDGYIFDGWYVDADLTTKLIIENKSDVPYMTNLKMVEHQINECSSSYESTIYAKWKKIETDACPSISNEYTTLRFNSNGGTKQNEIMICTSCSKKTVTLPTPTKNGYKFLGWYADSKLTTKITITSSSDNNLKKLSYIEEYTDSTKKCKTGAKSATLYAKWQKVVTEQTCPNIKEKHIYINFDSGTGETFEKIDVCTTCKFTNVELPEPKKEGYTFLGWYTNQEYNRKVEIINNQSPDLSVLEKKSSVDKKGCENGIENTTLYAKWQTITCPVNNLSYLNISYETNGMIGLSDTKICLSCSETPVEIPNPYQLGYIFGGWYADPEYKTLVNINMNTSYDIKKLILEEEKDTNNCLTGNKKTTLYARWFYYNDIEKINIKFQLFNSVIGKESYSINDSTIKLPNYEYPDYYVKEWYADENYTIPVNTKDDIAKSYYGASLSDNGHELNITLYAKPTEKEPVVKIEAPVKVKKINKVVVAVIIIAIIGLLAIMIKSFPRRSYW